MLLNEAIVLRINNLIKEKGMNNSKISFKGGIARSTMSEILNGNKKNTKIETILHICEGLEITIREFFDDPVFDNVEQD